MKTYVASLSAVLILSTAALAQQADSPRGTLNIDSLRSQVMSRYFGPADGQDLRFGFPQPLMPKKLDLDEQIWSEWGLALAPVPKVLYKHCPDLKPDTGLLVEKTRPGSAADRAGLAAGQVLVGTQDKWFRSAEDLPRLIEPQTLAVLVQGQFCQVDIQPDRVPLSVTAPRAAFRSAPTSVSAFTATADGAASQAISMAAANGKFDIDVSYATAEGQQKVHLRGTQKQVEKSMTDLPAPVQQAIKHRLQMVVPADSVY